MVNCFVIMSCSGSPDFIDYVETLPDLGLLLKLEVAFGRPISQTPTTGRDVLTFTSMLTRPRKRKEEERVTVGKLIVGGKRIKATLNLFPLPHFIFGVRNLQSHSKSLSSTVEAPIPAARSEGYRTVVFSFLRCRKSLISNEIERESVLMIE